MTFTKSRCAYRSLLAALALLLPQTAVAQDPAFNSVEISNWDEPGQDFADIWGDGSFAYIAHNGQRVVTIIDITDPANPVFASRYDAVSISSAQDVKVHDGLMFVGLEQSSAGVHIVDVRDPYAPVKLTDEQVELLRRLDDSMKKGGGMHSPHSTGWMDGVKKFFEGMGF